jgi:hypothetical protein
MKLNYKDTLQYKEDKKLFKLLLGTSITFFMIFFLLFLGLFFFLKRESLEIASIVCLTGIFLYLLFDLPFIIKTVMVKHNMNSILKNMDDIYSKLCLRIMQTIVFFKANLLCRLNMETRQKSLQHLGYMIQIIWQIHLSKLDILKV